MKNELAKDMSHEIGYVILVTITLVLLTLLVFPLFIALLPIAIIIGCASIWHLDHLNKNKTT